MNLILLLFPLVTEDKPSVNDDSCNEEIQGACQHHIQDNFIEERTPYLQDIKMRPYHHEPYQREPTHPTNTK